MTSREQSFLKRNSRFSYGAPNVVQMIWCMLLHADWRPKCGAMITDHERGENFHLSAEEEVVMSALTESMNALADQTKIKFWSLNRFWTPNRIDVIRDHVLAAISERRHGNPHHWEQFKAMSPDEWLAWLRSIVGDINASRPVV